MPNGEPGTGGVPWARLDAIVAPHFKNLSTDEQKRWLAGIRLVTLALAAYADPIIGTGGFGSALAIKLINNVLFCANAQLLAAAMEFGDSLGVDEDALLSALQVCGGGSQVATHAHRIGGMRTFVELAGPFLRKDIDSL